MLVFFYYLVNFKVITHFSKKKGPHGSVRRTYILATAILL